MEASLILLRSLLAYLTIMEEKIEEMHDNRSRESVDHMNYISDENEKIISMLGIQLWVRSLIFDDQKSDEHFISEMTNFKRKIWCPIHSWFAHVDDSSEFYPLATQQSWMLCSHKTTQEALAKPKLKHATSKQLAIRIDVQIHPLELHLYAPWFPAPIWMQPHNPLHPITIRYCKISAVTLIIVHDALIL